MGILFNGLRKKHSASQTELKQKRFSRFTDAVDGLTPTADVDKKFTRFASQDKTQAVPTNPRPQRRQEVSAPLQQAINNADHFTSEAEIPISILHRALPQRFAEQRDSKRKAIRA